MPKHQQTGSWTTMTALLQRGQLSLVTVYVILLDSHESVSLSDLNSSDYLWRPWDSSEWS